MCMELGNSSSLTLGSAGWVGELYCVNFGTMLIFVVHRENVLGVGYEDWDKLS